IYDILKEPFIIHGIKNKKEINERIKKIINLTGMKEEILSRYPHEFSGGQRQRIAIARAIMLYPSFIAADEPVSALDVSIQAQIVNLLLDLKQHLNLTMLFISHDLSVIKYISDRIAVMYLGEIVEISEKEELFKNHKHPYTQILLDSAPIIKDKNEKKQTQLKGEPPSPQNPPKGCKFHTRCPYAAEKCLIESPELIEINPNHKVRCFLFQKDSG
ncbi:MAG: ABC transporter ATP-binding protein, partial [Candidatus Gastranaerophilales bacterium]|nr:ABC transporter ATP-binding protein [Candidatus Gastranaerophilales bacterium]